MRPKLYMCDICPSSRAILLTAKYLQVTLELKIVNLSTKNDDIQNIENYKRNNQHMLPTLEDNGYIIWDSHAIIAYLVGKYGKDDSLYPKNLDQRTKIDERLCFDSSVVAFFTKLIFSPIVSHRKNAIINDDQIDCLNQTYEIVENFFNDNNNNQWICGDNLTIADFSLIPSITYLDLFVPIDGMRFPKLINWIKRAELMPFYEINRAGLEQLKATLLKI